ncbi:MAG: 6-bladed beta-propeller [Verrucomicrobia bacterium]|nr:6-bladed beta-propeller [Verrucomicrobiota bacterium]
MKRISSLGFCTWSLAFLAALAATVSAQTPSPSPYSKTNVIVYPRVNVSPWYEVAPNWPQRPPDVCCGAVPGVALDKVENVWIHTRTNMTVQVFAPDGRYLRGWERESTSCVAHYIRIDKEQNVWLADVGLHVVRKFSPDRKLLLTLGTPGVAGEDETHFYKPTDMTVAPNGDIFVSDGYGNSRIVRFDRNGRYITAWGKMGNKPGEFSLPHSIVCDSKGRLYVADRNNIRIQVFNADGKLLAVWKDLIVPWGLFVTPKDEIWVCGSSPMYWRVDPKYPKAPLGCPPKDQFVMKFNTDGKLLQLWTFPKAEDGQEKPGELNWLHGLAVDSKGNLYCGDIIGKRIQKFILKK